MYFFKCDLCDADSVGFISRQLHLHQRVEEHKRSVIGNHDCLISLKYFFYVNTILFIALFPKLYICGLFFYPLNLKMTVKHSKRRSYFSSVVFINVLLRTYK